MTALERLKVRLPDVQNAQLEALLEDAEGMILAYTGRSRLPRVLETAKVQLAAVLYNRAGMEGELSHSEGGVSRAMDALPGEIKMQLSAHRLAKVVSAHAAL